jgi:serine/threonine protein kinase
LDTPEKRKDSLLAELTPPPVEVPRPHQQNPASDTAGSSFTPGAVLAGRYRMVTRIGRGGMGEVWRADDLILNTPIALKFVESASDTDRAQVLREVRLARQITHPAVCRVFDVGDADGKIFYSMELVKGEDLATLLRHAGRLPSEKVIDIGLQLCGGLAAAHAQGVLHRDLKPANVLIDDDGAVRVTDFGIAIARKDATRHTPIGTPGYMAPEQISPNTPLSEKTDLYALGLILYELVVGKRPFPDSTRPAGPPARPSTVVPDVDPRLERAVMQALARDPRERPRSAASLAAALESPASAAATSRSYRPWLAGAALALVVAAVAVFSSRFLTPKAALTDRDTIILSDFVNTTGEPVFDGALKVALAVALEQSTFLKVFSDDNVRATLRLMQR